MVRWAVDVAGIDVEDDLRREEKRAIPMATPNYRQSFLRERTGGKSGGNEWKCIVGQVVTLEPEELECVIRSRLDVDRWADVPPGVCLSLAPPSGERVGHSGTFASLEPESPITGPEVRVFCTFLNPQGKRTAFSLCMKQSIYRGVDIVSAFLQQAVAPDSRLSQRFSLNPRVYKLFLADEFTGEEEMAVQLDLPAHNFSCYAVQPLPAAKTYLFPQRTEMLPMVHEDIKFSVEVRPLDPQGKPLKRDSVVPPDMLAESLEASIIRMLPSCGIVQGSLRIKYGPLELNINEYYNFGAGCGQPSCPIAERTVLSLYRFGVTEAVVHGRFTEKAQTTDVGDAIEDIVIDMDVEKAQTLQQFEVVRITCHGARQQRVLCIDGDRLYTLFPGTTAAAENAATIRLIADIEEVRAAVDNPRGLVIVYTRASRHEEDHFECTTTYNTALLDEKLHVLRREQRKRAEAAMEQQTVLQRFLHRLLGR